MSISADNLRLSYGDLVALDGVSFKVEPGETVVMLGPNGAGKTSAVEVCEGFRKPDSGTATVLGGRMSDPSVRARVGVMPQESGWWSVARPAETLEMLAGLYANPQSPAELIDHFKIPPSTAYRRLSLGEKQRLSFAMAVIGRPDVLFCDEPTAGMDPFGRALVWEAITQIRDAGGAVLVTTHLLDEAERHADRVVVLSGGRVVADGPPASLSSRTIWFRLSKAVSPAELEGPLKGVERDGVGYTASSGTLADLNSVAAGLGVEVLEWRSSSLDDLYRKLTGDSA